MRRLDRHLYRELFPPFLIGTVFVVLMFQANILIALYKNLNLSAVPVSGILRFVLLKTPEFLVLTLPVGAALASALALSRIIRESEMTAMRAAGASVRRILRPVVVMGVAVSLLNWFLSERLAPMSSVEARKVESEMGALALAPNFKSNVTVNLERYTASFGSVQAQGRDTMLLTDILLVERRGQGENTIIQSPNGSYQNGIWVLQSPVIWNMRGGTAVSMESATPMVIEEPIAVPDFFMAPQPQELSTEDLRRQIATGRQLKQDTTRLEVAYHVKYSVPASCLVFALTGAGMALLFGRGGAFAGTLMSMGCVWLHFNLYIVSTEIFGRNGWVAPWLAAWLPNVLLAAFGIWAIRRAE